MKHKDSNPHDVYVSVLDQEALGGKKGIADILEDLAEKSLDPGLAGGRDWDVLARFYDLAFDLGKEVDLVSALSALESGARECNPNCAAVLGSAVLYLYSRRQVVADGLSWLARAANEGVVGAHAALAGWYARRCLAKDLLDYEDVDVGLDSCYVATKKSPPVPFPPGARDCLREFWLWTLRGIAAGCGPCCTVPPGIGIPTDILFADPELLDRAAATGNASARIVAARYRLRDGASRPERKRAVGELRDLAEGGNAQAAFELAMAYDDDRNGISAEEAVRWFEAAAKGGVPAAMFYLGDMHREGVGVPADEEKAAEWYRRGAEAGEPNCCFQHGSDLYENAATDKERREGIRWVRRAAEERDLPEAWAFMSRVYTTGAGLYVNKKKAAECLKRAKQLGWKPDGAGDTAS